MLQVWATVAEKTLPTVAANYVIWPAAHIISFKYVPSQQRILYNNSIAIFWNCYLSLVAADIGSDSSAGSGWSWDAYAFWTGLPGGFDPSLTQSVSEVYQNVQIALGIHTSEPASAVLASDLSKMYQDLQNAAMGHTSAQCTDDLATSVTQLYHDLQIALGFHRPEPVGGLAGVVQGFRPLSDAVSAAPHSTGLTGRLQDIAETVAKAQDVVQGGMNEAMPVASFWLKHFMHVRALDCTFSLSHQSISSMQISPTT